MNQCDASWINRNTASNADQGPAIPSVNLEESLISRAKDDMLHQLDLEYEPFIIEDNPDIQGFRSLGNCVVVYQSNGEEGVKMIAVAPRKVQPKYGTEFKTGTKHLKGFAPTTNYGPIHWLLVAKIMAQSLFVSTWVSAFK